MQSALLLAKKTLIEYGFHAPMLLHQDRDGLKHATLIHGDHGTSGALFDVKKKLREAGSTEYILISQSRSQDALMAHYVTKQPYKVILKILGFTRYNGSSINFEPEIEEQGKPRDFGPMAKLLSSNVHVPGSDITKRIFS